MVGAPSGTTAITFKPVSNFTDKCARLPRRTHVAVARLFNLCNAETQKGDIVSPSLLAGFKEFKALSEWWPLSHRPPFYLPEITASPRGTGPLLLDRWLRYTDRYVDMAIRQMLSLVLRMPESIRNPGPIEQYDFKTGTKRNWKYSC